MKAPFLAGLAALCAAWPLVAQSRLPVVDAVDLSVPMPPASVQIAGHQTIVHELHITNFQNADVLLSRVRVIDARTSATLADYATNDLRARLGRPGLSRQQPAPDLIAPGSRAVVFLWIELPSRVPASVALRHQVEVEIRRPAGTVSAVVDGPATMVSTATPAVLAPPLRGGPWTAIYDPLLMGGHRTAFYTVDGRARIPGRFAIDWIRAPGAGAALARDAARRSPDLNGYGAEVLAVADGTVAAAMDDIPENAEPPVATATPMPPENASGNYVSLDLGGGRFAFYEHLRRGSVTVRAGDRVKSGQVIGRLGNSGSSSIGPHLHFHVADANATLGAEGLPFVFRRFELVGAFASIGAVGAGESWQPVAAGSSTGRRLERPGPNVVVNFP